MTGLIIVMAILAVYSIASLLEHALQEADKEAPLQYRTKCDVRPTDELELSQFDGNNAHDHRVQLYVLRGTQGAYSVVLNAKQRRELAAALLDGLPPERPATADYLDGVYGDNILDGDDD